MAPRQTRSASKKMQSASNPAVVDNAPVDHTTQDVSNDNSATKVPVNPGTVDLETSKTSETNTNTNTGDTDHIITMDNEDKDDNTNEDETKDGQNDAEKDKDGTIASNTAAKDSNEDEEMLVPVDEKEKEVTDDDDEVEVIEPDQTPDKHQATASLHPGCNAGSYSSAVANGTPLTHNGQPTPS